VRCIEEWGLKQTLQCQKTDAVIGRRNEQSWRERASLCFAGVAAPLVRCAAEKKTNKVWRFELFIISFTSTSKVASRDIEVKIMPLLDLSADEQQQLPPPWNDDDGITRGRGRCQLR
jgi:hypothetical protein